MAQYASESSEFVGRIRWYIYLRWLLVIAITLPSIVNIIGTSSVSQNRLFSLGLSAGFLVTNVLFAALSRLGSGNSFHRRLSMCVLAFDIVFISYYIFNKGGIESRSIVLYVIPMLMSATLFGRRGVYSSAISSAAGYNAIILVNYWNVARSPGQLTQRYADTQYVISTIVYISTVLFVVALLIDFVTRLLVDKERQASATAATLERAQAISKVGSWEWNVATNAVEWSSELYRLFEVPTSTNVDYGTYLQCIHPDDRRWAADAIERAIKNKQSFSFDHRVLLADDSELMIHSEGKVAVDRRGRVTNLFGTAHDITAERVLEAAKGDFVSLASHQLRTPASGVRMLLALLRDGYIGELSVEQRKAIEQAFDANERLLRIADDLLNVAKLESGRLVLDKQPIDFTDWLRTTIRPHQLLAKDKNQKLIIDIPKQSVIVQADPARLSMVLDNLLSNALKYTPAKGTITVALKANTRSCTLVVSDTGSGMTRSEIAQLFGKFTRLDNQASRGVEGSGLGLYLVKSIVDLHQGTISVRSKPNAGSAFTVHLKRSSARRLAGTPR